MLDEPKLTAPVSFSKKECERNVSHVSQPINHYLSLHVLLIMIFWIPANNLLGDSATSFVALATAQVVAAAQTIKIIAQKGFLFDSVIDRLDRPEEFGGGRIQ